MKVKIGDKIKHTLFGGVIDVDNGHWTYFDQVIEVLEHGKD